MVVRKHDYTVNSNIFSPYIAISSCLVLFHLNRFKTKTPLIIKVKEYDYLNYVKLMNNYFITYKMIPDYNEFTMLALHGSQKELGHISV